MADSGHRQPKMPWLLVARPRAPVGLGASGGIRTRLTAPSADRGRSGRNAPAFAGGSIGTVAPQIGQPVGHIPAASVLRNEVGDIVTSLTGASRTLDAEHRELPLNVAENVVGGGQERGALQRIC